MGARPENDRVWVSRKWPRSLSPCKAYHSHRTGSAKNKRRSSSWSSVKNYSWTRGNAALSPPCRAAFYPNHHLTLPPADTTPQTARQRLANWTKRRHDAVRTLKNQNPHHRQLLSAFPALILPPSLGAVLMQWQLPQFMSYKLFCCFTTQSEE